MNRKPAWFLPVAVVVTCVPCLLIPIGAAVIAAGAFGGLLGFMGVPWVFALVLVVPLSGALLCFRFRTKGPAC